jgi:hypothetical protein
MPRLSSAQQEARQQINSLAGSRLHPQQLASKLLQALVKAVPSDGGGLVGLDPTTLLHNRLLAAVPGSMSLVSDYYRSVYLSDPVPELLPPALMRAGLPMVVVHRQLEYSLGLPKRLLRALRGGRVPCLLRRTAAARWKSARGVRGRRAVDRPARVDPSRPRQPLQSGRRRIRASHGTDRRARPARGL